MTGQLHRSVGKFVYPRGGSMPLHFMPLQDFHLEDALELSLLIALRSERTGLTWRLGGLQLSRWMDVILVERIATLARTILGAKGHENWIPNLLEHHAGMGVTFETLQWLLARDGEDARITYTAVGPELARRRFELLHQGEEGVSYQSPKQVTAVHADLTIVNHLNAARRGEERQDIETVVNGSTLPMILALRVCEGDSAALRTTVSGNRVMLPALERVKRLLRTANHKWRYYYLSGHDAAYFLPEPGPEVGVLLTYATDGPVNVPRFRLIETA